MTQSDTGTVDAATSALFPKEWTFDIGGEEPVGADAIIELLTPHISEDRRARIDAVVAQRTYSVVTVCDNLYDTGNVAAVMRSAEAMGIQEFHSIQLHDQLKRSQRITAGADKWLDIHHWRDRAACVEAIQARGYRIVATQLSDDCVDISEVDFTEAPTAIVFGNEHDGVSPEVLEASDMRCILPMTGFAESYNISVAAALSFYHIRRDRLSRGSVHGDLTERERAILRADYYMRSINKPHRLLRGLLARQNRGCMRSRGSP